MRELIISDYDGGCEFTALIINDNKIEKRIHSQYLLEAYGLYDDEWHWFTPKLINKENKKIQQFDRIIYCEDGCINVYWKGKSY